MIPEIESVENPEWLYQNEFKFDVKAVLKDSLYYPAARFDGDPVKYFAGNVYSFLYVDYGVSRGEFLSEIHHPRYSFRGYHILHQEPITEEQLTPNGWTVKIFPERTLATDLGRFERDRNEGVIKKPFCEWVIFERDKGLDKRHGPERFSLLYLCADGVAAYQAIYLSNNIRPKIIAIIQPGTGFGNNWTDFRDEKEIFARSVFHYEDLLPDYIIDGWWHSGSDEDFNNNENSFSPIWKRYSKWVTTIITGTHILVIWKRSY
jgi:hypothetical protein